MVASIIGTFTSTKGQDLVDFLVSIGVSKDVASKVLGTQWTLKVWKHEDIWGCYLRCHELPHLNLWQGFALGDEKEVELPILGGMVKVCSKMNGTGDGFVTTFISKTFGSMTLESKFTEDGLTTSLTCKGKTVKGVWERRVKVEGSYMFSHGENIEAYLKAVGESQIGHHYHNYKIHVHENGKMYRLSEYVGELGRVTNTMELDVLSPFRLPGEKEDSTPSHKGMLTKTGMGKFTLMCKSKAGVQEEWKMVFSKWGVVMTGVEKNTGLTCKFFMRRFWDMIGTYNLVSYIGLDKFAVSVGGMTLAEVEDMMKDTSTKLRITAHGEGHYRHQLMRKRHPLDYSFTMDREFSMVHPVIHEEITIVPKMIDSGTLLLTSSTGKGEILQKFYFNNEFCIISMSLPKAHMRCKAIFEKVHPKA